MPVIEINGKRVKVDDGFLDLPPDQQEAVVAEIAGSFPNDNVATQAMYGANEGLANMAGLPVDMTNAAIGLGMKGINAVAGTDFQPSEKPFLGSDYIKDKFNDAGFIGDPSDSGTAQFARRVGQEIGAAAVPVAGTLGMGARSLAQGGKGLLADAARNPAKLLRNEAAVATGSGMGAATAQQIAPDNPYAEMAGQILGGAGAIGTGLATRPFRRASAARADSPTLENLQAMKSQAYKNVDNLGVTYNPRSIDQLRAGVKSDLQAGQIDPIFNPKASYGSKIFEQKLTQNIPKNPLDPEGEQILVSRPTTLSELDKMRQFIGQNVVDPKAGPYTEGRFGGMIRDNIDGFIDSTNPAMLQSGNAQEAAGAIKKARDANRMFRNTEAFDMAMENAANRAGSTGSGGNLQNLQKQEVKKLLDKKGNYLSESQRKIMLDIIRGDKKENIARTVGRVSPEGNGLGMLTAGYAVGTNPALLPIPIIGGIARRTSEKMTQAKLDVLRAALATGKDFGDINSMKLNPIDKEIVTNLILRTQPNAEKSLNRALVGR